MTSIFDHVYDMNDRELVQRYVQVCEANARTEEENIILKHSIDHVMALNKAGTETRLRLYEEIERLKSQRSDLHDECKNLEDKTRSLQSRNAILEMDSRLQKKTIQHLEERSLVRDRRILNLRKDIDAMTRKGWRKNKNQTSDKTLTWRRAPSPERHSRSTQYRAKPYHPTTKHVQQRTPEEQAPPNYTDNLLTVDTTDTIILS